MIVFLSVSVVESVVESVMGPVAESIEKLTGSHESFKFVAQW